MLWVFFSKSVYVKIYTYCLNSRCFPLFQLTHFCVKFLPQKLRSGKRFDKYHVWSRVLAELPVSFLISYFWFLISYPTTRKGDSCCCCTLSQKSGSIVLLLYFSNMINWIGSKLLTVLTTWFWYFLILFELSSESSSVANNRTWPSLAFCNNEFSINGCWTFCTDGATFIKLNAFSIIIRIVLDSYF